MPSRFLHVTGFAIALGLSSGAHANQVANGGFEDGNAACAYSIPSWSGGAFLGPVLSSDTANCLPGYPAHSGTKYVAIASNGGTVSVAQNIATVAGQTYHLQFFLDSDGVRPNEFEVTWAGQSLLSLVNSPATSYVEYNFDVSATSAFSTLAFNARTDFGYWLLDDVSLVATNVSAVPEPGSMALFGTGLAVIAALRKRSLSRRAAASSRSSFDGTHAAG